MSVGTLPSDAILLYEDDESLAREIVCAFSVEGLEVSLLGSESDLRAALEARRAAVLVLDRMIRGRDSLVLLAELRAAGDQTPAIVISSLATVDDRIRGLKAGGDDYLVKPFAMGELVARVAALRRRLQIEPRTTLTVGPLNMDLIARTVHRDGRPIILQPREFRLLEYFMRHAGQVVTRAMLLEHVWNYQLSAQTNVVDVHVGNLRRKIDAAGENRLIANIRGLGFKLSSDNRPS